MRPTKRQRLFREALLRKQRAPERRVHTPIKKYGHWWWRGGLWLVFIGVCLWGAVLSPWFTIETITVSGETSISSEKIQALLWAEVRHPFWKVLPQRNLIFISPHRLATLLGAQYPKFSRVDIYRVFPHQLTVVVAERPFLVEWCSGGPCFLIQNGRAEHSIAEIPEYAPARLVIIDRSGQDVVAGQTFSGVELVDFMAALWEEWPQESLALIPEAETPSRHSAELRLRTQAGFELWVATDRPLAETIAAWELIHDKVFQPETIAQLAVVDLRTAGKAFLRSRNIASEAATLDTEAAPSEKSEKTTIKNKQKKESD